MDDTLDRWTDAARFLHWDTPWHTLRAGDDRPGRWFAGGELNVATNCLDRHLRQRSGTVALHWEGEPGDRRSLTYAELFTETCACARMLETLGVGRDDRVALYLGAVPELFVALLACARIGALACVLPVSLPVEALAERLAVFEPRLVLTQDGAWRHGVVLPLKARADEALAATGTVEHVAVVRRTGIDVAWYDDDRWYHELLSPEKAAAPHRAVPLPADHPLLVHYLPGPSALRAVVHRGAPMLALAAAMHRLVFAPDTDDIFWPALEVAYAAGTTHGMFGPLACGGTSVIYEGMLDTPTTDRAPQIIERYGVTSALTFPSILRALQRWWGEGPSAHMASLRRVATAGEPLEERERRWLASTVGHPLEVLDGWGQTELGGIVSFTPIPDGTGPLPDPGLDVVDSEGRTVPAGETGELVLQHPWPATFLDAGDDVTRHWMATNDGALYRSGDMARREPDGTITVVERLDPMVKVSGQFVSLASVAGVLCQHPLVEDAEVIQIPRPEGVRFLVAWVVPTADALPGPELASDLRNDLHEMLGGLSVPHAVAFVEGFPPELSSTGRRLALRSLAPAEQASVRTLTLAELRKAAGIA